MKSVLIGMAVHDSPENKRAEFTMRCIDQVLQSIEATGFNHDLYIIDNASTCPKTRKYLRNVSDHPSVILITNEKNIGTAEAINKAWRYRQPGQHCVKMDNDVFIHDLKWIDQLRDAIEREPTIGICGLKRKDCWEHPEHEQPDLRSTLFMLPHQAGERWIVGERVFHVMGTCQMYNSAFLDKIGYLYQPSLYGYDDVLAAHRAAAAGYWSVFLPHIEIDHIDPGDTPYQKWKEDHSSEVTQEVIRISREYRNGSRPIYYNPFNA